MECIFFEKQEGALCAQHALNALLQGPYFTAVDLATIARTLDVHEREVMGQGGVDTPEYLRAFQQDSYNMDDTGFFSVQVITAALRVWNLRLVPYTADEEEAGLARADPTSQTAYICNFREHWFTIRKFASQQWFNLNSVLNGPEPISPTYLHLFLSQLQTEGYSIFIIDGPLPQCQADVELLLRPPVQAVSAAVGGSKEEEDPELAAALALSLGRPVGQSKAGSSRRDSSPDVHVKAALAASAREIDDEDQSLKEALARSLADQDDEDLKAALLLSMTNGDDSQPSTSGMSASSAASASTEPQKASTVPSSAEPNLDDLRAKRAAFFDRSQDVKPDAKEEKK